MSVTVVEVVPEDELFVVEVEGPGSPGVGGVPTDVQPGIYDPAGPTSTAEVEAPGEATVIEVQVPGAPGPPGAPGASGTSSVFEYLMPIPATTVTIDHNLGRDPVAVQVFLEGMVAEEYAVFFTVPGEQVQLSFDLAVAAFIRLL